MAEREHFLTQNPPQALRTCDFKQIRDMQYSSYFDRHRYIVMICFYASSDNTDAQHYIPEVVVSHSLNHILSQII